MAATAMSLATSSPAASFAVAPLPHAASGRAGGLSVHAFPLKGARKPVRVVAARASAETNAEQPSRTAVLLSGFIGVAAAASVGLSGNAIAASGPGLGAEGTAQKAGELLQSADELTTDDSPPRFGGFGVDNTSKLARQAGTGADDAIQGTQDAASDVVGQAKEGVDTAVAKAPSPPNFFSSLQESLANLTGSAPSPSDAQSAADKVAADAAAKLPTPGDAGSVLDNLKAKLPGQ